ncbi:unnamed protein product [Amoebophrya sp. A25]|nr:unnamed protein product [Amoebophrya sp. A25]|eukprot:GSA25T00013968001.1
MEFDFNVARTLGLSGHNGIACLSGEQVGQAAAASDIRHLGARRLAPNDPSLIKKQLCDLIESVGRASQVAQNLRAPVTNLLKLTESPDQRVYIAVRDRNTVLGLLKVGPKKLFVQNPGKSSADLYARSSASGAVSEITPLCVLDFYVHESSQRRGFGKQMFDYVLWKERKTPAKFAYDRPSAKLLSFLGKHYDLKQYTPQTNNFVVYHKYFSSSSGSSSSAAASSGRGGSSSSSPCPIDFDTWAKNLPPSSGGPEHRQRRSSGEQATSASPGYNGSSAHAQEDYTVNLNVDQEKLMQMNPIPVQNSVAAKVVRELQPTRLKPDPSPTDSNGGHGSPRRAREHGVDKMLEQVSSAVHRRSEPAIVPDAAAHFRSAIQEQKYVLPSGTGVISNRERSMINNRQHGGRSPPGANGSSTSTTGASSSSRGMNGSAPLVSKGRGRTSSGASPLDNSSNGEHFTRPAYLHYRERQQSSSAVASLISGANPNATSTRSGAGAGTQDKIPARGASGNKSTEMLHSQHRLDAAMRDVHKGSYRPGRGSIF